MRIGDSADNLVTFLKQLPIYHLFEHWNVIKVLEYVFVWKFMIKVVRYKNIFFE